MLNYFRIEVKKMMASSKWIIGIIIIASSCFICAMINKDNNIFTIENILYKDYMIYNSKDIVLGSIFPIGIIFIAASLFGGEIETGVLKSYLCNRKQRVKIYYGKQLYICILSLLIPLAVFFFYTIFGMILFRGINIMPKELFYMIEVYFFSGIGTWPIILIAIDISMIFEDFLKGFSVSLILLLLSFGIEAIKPGVFYTFTFCGSHSAQVCKDGSLEIIPVAVCMAYCFALFISGVLIIKKKDIWR